MSTIRQTVQILYFFSLIFGQNCWKKCHKCQNMVLKILIGQVVQILACFPLYLEISANFSWFWGQSPEALDQKWSYGPKNWIKGCVHYIFTSLFCIPEIEDWWNKEKCFLFHFESSFCSWDNQILDFQIFQFHDVIKCPSMKHEIHFIE